MAHIHSVYDGDTHFTIDPITRKIKNTTGKVVLMQNDHNSERFTFELPRYIDGHDMSLCNKVEVHYINIDAKDKTQTNGVYPVSDLQISPDSDDVVICSWLISQNATKRAGSLSFVLRYACLDGEIIEYQWFTDIHSGVSVAASISNGETVVTEYADILEQWRLELLNASGGDSPVIKRVESLDKDNMVNLRDLEDGIYILTGYFKPFPGSDSTLIVENGFYMVARLEEGSHLLAISPLNFKMTCHEILVDDTAEEGFTYTNKRINLLDLSQATARIADVELLAANWEGDESLYSQIVNIDGITENSQVDLTPSVEQLAIFYEKDLGFVTENENGIVTVYAIGQKPQNDYVIQVTITEVSV